MPGLETAIPRSRLGLGLAWRVKKPTSENKDESNHGLRGDNEGKDVGQDRDGDIRTPERPLPDLAFSNLSLPEMAHLCNKLLFGSLARFVMLFCSL